MSDALIRSRSFTNVNTERARSRRTEKMKSVLRLENVEGVTLIWNGPQERLATQNEILRRGLSKFVCLKYLCQRTPNNFLKQIEFVWFTNVILGAILVKKFYNFILKRSRHDHNWDIL